MMKFVKPKITNCLEKDFYACCQENEFDNVRIENQTLDKKIAIENTTFDGCIFKGIDFSQITLNNIDLIDVIFENCDLSNQKFNERFISRVTFKNCN